MSTVRPDPHEPARSRRFEASWNDRAVFGGGVLAVTGVLSNRWPIVLAGVALMLALGWVVLRRLEGRVTVRGIAWLAVLNGMFSVGALVFLLGDQGTLGVGAIVAAVAVGPWVASSITGVAR